MDFKDFLINECGYSIPLYSEKSDVWSALTPLITTVAIVYDCSEFSFKERYCFRDPALALTELIAWHSRDFNEQKPTGWVACRHVNPKELQYSMDTYQTYSEEFYGARILDYMESLNLTYFFREEDYANAAKALGTTINQIVHEAAYLRAIGKIQ